MLRSRLCNYSDPHMLVKRTITVVNTAAPGQTNNGANKKVIFKNCATFTNCISRIKNTELDDASCIDAVMPIYNLIECSDNCLKTSENLWQFYVPAVNANGAIVGFKLKKN